MKRAQVVLGEQKIPVGELLFEEGKTSHSVFTYTESWLQHPLGFDLSHSLPRLPGPYHASSSGRASRKLDVIHGPFSDGAPDSWGRKLLRQVLGESASEFDFLVSSEDVSRQGALRYLDEKGNLFSASLPPVPRITDLDTLNAITMRYEKDPNGADKEMRQLAGAAGSLGGARPKANCRDGADLWIAKFTSINDTWPVERLEIATMTLAKQCGLRVPDHRLALQNSDHPVALFKRFDRHNGARIPYISVRTALGKLGDTGGSYVEIADMLTSLGHMPAEDKKELWMRMIFGMLVSNTDDHLKNHGLVYVTNNRWRLSKLFDVNPQPKRDFYMETSITPTSIGTPSVAEALDTASHFGLNKQDAQTIAGQIAHTIHTTWKQRLKECGINAQNLKKCAPAFEHERAEDALRLYSR